MKKKLLFCLMGVCFTVGISILCITMFKKQDYFVVRKSDFQIEVNGEKMILTMPLVTINDVAYGPLGEVTDAMGAGIEFNKDEQKISINADNISYGETFGIDYWLYNSYTVDTDDVAKFFNLKDGQPFTFFEQVRDIETWKNLRWVKESNFPLSEFDFYSEKFPGKYLAITFGRKLENLRWKPSEKALESNKEMVVAEVTFAKEYQAQTMYLYIMDPRPIFSASTGGYNVFYVMDDSKKIYLGDNILKINARLLDMWDIKT